MEEELRKYYRTLANAIGFWPDLELCWNSSYSQGGIVKGRPWMKIAMSHAIGDRLPYRVYETQELDTLPDIGGFYTDRPEHKLYLHICHEFSHAYQKYYTRECKHGPVFKAFYRELRLRFLNVLLPPQDDMQQRYKIETKKILTLAYTR